MNTTEYEVCLNKFHPLQWIIVHELCPELAITTAMFGLGAYEVNSADVYKNNRLVLQCGRCTLTNGHLHIKG